MTGPDPPVLSNVTDDLSWGRIAGCFAEPDDGLAADSCRKAACRKAGLAQPVEASRCLARDRVTPSAGL